ncbi:hypothetical protein D3C79_627890 [compost metagenome]
MLKQTINSKEQLKEAYKKFKDEASQFGIEVPPGLFVHIVFSDPVRYEVDRDLLLQSFSVDNEPVYIQ